ncbi:MAG: cation transporter [Pseudomonadaceae bacterium]|jgi:hypothetical protein|nr:cation transporter [Pseudomonadaceae bacterium]
MNLPQLLQHAREGRIEELNLICIEGGIYLLEICLDGQRHLLRDKQAQTFRLRSVEHARDLLQELPPVPFHLIHAVVHEEMCGLPAGPQQRLRVPISLASQW